MSWSSPFGAFLHALTGGRYSSSSCDRGSGSSVIAREWGDLLSELELPPSALDEVASSGSLYPHFQYRPFKKRKKNGGVREIVEPDTKLKRIQQVILSRHLASEEPHRAALAYRRRKSVADHVWAHADAEILVVADIRDFFPSTPARRIEDWWQARVVASLAPLLTLLTTYRGELPQGAPTSPCLSNLVNREMDERLSRRAEFSGARYTRYCDDMVFSWRYTSAFPSDFEAGTRALLHEYGYTLHSEKGWRVHRRSDEPEITGVILTRHGKVRLSESMRKKMRSLSNSKDPNDAQRLAGYNGFESMVTTRPTRTKSPAAPSPHPPPEKPLPRPLPPPISQREPDEEWADDDETTIPF
jgi:RNA-directed DNA polymerase